MTPNVSRLARWFKFVSALMFIVCYALPMSSCEPPDLNYQSKAVEKAPVIEEQPPEPSTKSTRTYYYILPLDDRTSSGNWAAAFVFAVPAIILLYTRKRPRGRPARILWRIEPFIWGLLFGTVSAFNFLATSEIGSSVALGSIVVYGAGWLGEAFVKLRFRQISWQALGILLGCGPILGVVGALPLAGPNLEWKSAVFPIGLFICFAIALSLGLNALAKRGTTTR